MKQITVRPEDRAIWDEIERDAWRLPRQITVSEWADESRVLDSMTSAEPGQWRTARTPYLRGIMDAFSDPNVQQITVVKSTQIGGTESIYNMIGYAVDQDPAPAMLVMPREEDVKTVSTNRIKPMMEHSPALARHLPRLSDEITKLEYHLDRMILYFAGSNSPAALASKPVRYLFLDEVDKFPKFSGREADPIKLSRERTRTFWNRKIVIVSTPTTAEGYVWKEYDRSDRRRYYVPCPFCGKYQVLVFGQVKWPEEEADADTIAAKRLAWYECAECGKRITDQHKLRMLQRGVWAPDGADIKQDGTFDRNGHDPRHVGFWINAIYSPWLTFSEIAAEFLHSKDYINELMNFVNSWLAEVWEEKTEETDVDFLKKRCAEYVEGAVPAKVLVLTAGVDVQQDHFILTIRGWGIGEESWLIRAARVESWQDVQAIICQTHYAKAPGINLAVRLANIDAGYRPDEVYEFCREWGDICRPIKGQEVLHGAPFRISKLDRNPATGETIKEGLSLWSIDTTHFKNKVNRLVHAEPGDLAKWHLFQDVSEQYLKQFCAEKKVIERDRRSGRSREVWKMKSTHGANHFWDAEVYATAAADMIHVSAMRDESQAIVYETEKQPRRREGWVRRGERGPREKRGSWVHGR